MLTDDPDDPTTAPVITEIAGTSISSTFPDEFIDIVEAVQDELPNVRYINAQKRGYVVCDVSPGEMRVEYRTVDDATQPQAQLETDATWIITDGNPDPRPA